MVGPKGGPVVSSALVAVVEVRRACEDHDSRVVSGVEAAVYLAPSVGGALVVLE